MTLAYLDAGSGSAILAALAGGSAGMAAIVRAKWHGMKSRSRRDDTVETPQPDEVGH